MTEHFIVKKNTDIFGGDCGYYPGKTPSELALICETIPEAIGFNSMGYIKSAYGKTSDLLGCNLYIDQQRLNEIVKSKTNIACGNVRKNITFAITFEGNVEKFIETMDLFLYHCVDPQSFNKWLCITSSEKNSDMTTLKLKYPFFEFVNKPPERHHFNTILSKIKTRYVMILPSNWEITESFNASLYVDYIRNNSFDQIVFGIGDVSLHTKVATLNKKDVFKYNYNHSNPEKNTLPSSTLASFERLESKYDSSKYSAKKGHHCPGFSFSLSIFDRNKLKNLEIREDVELPEAELEFAFSCLTKNAVTVFT